ncbi:hypothetical protein [Pasteurella multocida]|uniref:hypothetical protein n=1 Tax=Pasteurella multocida TaxID=747 RepID=UPI0010403CED|nr:hypothetical protein [Pasteurella multocida]TCH94321.1 hypothetical protein E0F65_07255 [Pasteurella multocida]HED4451849.1 hypothetical protein [Pasteurella multocida]
MGFGGILAAMAQGLGTGMIKVADEGWKKAADERKFKFYADENEKGRAHDFALADHKFEQEKQMEDIKTRNAIALMAHKTRMGAKSSVNKDNINRFNDIRKAIEQGEKQISAINAAIENAAGNEKEIARLNSIKEGIQKEINSRMESEEFYELGQNSGLGYEIAMQHYISSGGFVPEKYKPKSDPIIGAKSEPTQVAPPTTMIAAPEPYSPRVPRIPKNMDVSFGKLINNIGEDIKKTKPRHPMGIGFIPTQNE